MKGRKSILLALCMAIFATATSCQKTLPKINPSEAKVFIVYSCGHNNLSGSLLQDIEDIGKTAPLPPYDGLYKIVVFNHRSYRNTSDWSIEMDPALYRLYRNNNGEVVKDTLITYKGKTGSDPAVMKEVLTDVAKLFPASEYGFLFSSHGTGWLPYNYYANGTKTAGADYTGQGSLGTPSEMDVKDFAKAFPFKMKYILMDACFMGGIETAYELKDVCDYYLGSQTEIWGDGLTYDTMLSHLFSGQDTESFLSGICADFMAHYRNRNQPATISTVRTSGLNELGKVCAKLTAQHRDALEAINPSTVQGYMPQTSTPKYWEKTWFFDLQDIYVNAGISEQEKAELQNALDASIVCKDATKTLFDGSALKTFCGLSMYLPCAGNAFLSTYYKDYMWNAAVTLVE